MSNDSVIFAVGLLVTCIVGSGLGVLIFQNNRATEKSASRAPGGTAPQ